MKGIIRQILVLYAVTIPVNATGQELTQESRNWTIRTRILMTGSSDKSNPPGYLVYSAIAIEPSVNRNICKNFSVDFNFRTESHEVDIESNDDQKEDSALGSIELIPLNLLLQYKITLGKTEIYFAAGGNATFCWEKSGVLNSMDLTAGIGPSIQLGVDKIISENLLLNFNLGWNKLKTSIKDKGEQVAELQIDPISLGIGIGYRF